MHRILDRVAISSSQFCPTTVQEFFALQLARKLDDAENLGRYIHLTAETPRHVLLMAFRRAVKKGKLSDQQFHLELDRIEEDAAV